MTDTKDRINRVMIEAAAKAIRKKAYSLANIHHIPESVAKSLAEAALTAALKLAEPVWTDEPPEEAGWYWCEMVGCCVEAVEVFIRPGHSYLCIENPGDCSHTKRDFLMIGKLNAKWSGPIPTPKEG